MGTSNHSFYNWSWKNNILLAPCSKMENNYNEFIRIEVVKKNLFLFWHSNPLYYTWGYASQVRRRKEWFENAHTLHLLLTFLAIQIASHNGQRSSHDTLPIIRHGANFGKSLLLQVEYTVSTLKKEGMMRGKEENSSKIRWFYHWRILCGESKRLPFQRQ